LTLLRGRDNLSGTPRSWEITRRNSVVNKENAMKINRICGLVLLVVMATAMAFGDSVTDPTIIIHGVSSSTPAPLCPAQGCTNVGLNFTFGVPNNKTGSGQLFFTNASGRNWTSLTLIENGTVPASAINCVQSLFLSCTTKTLANGSVAIVLSGLKGNNPRNGILAGQSFSIQFACLNKTDCWPGGLEFTAHATAVPEPGAIALMVTGLGVLVSRRKMWKIRSDS
jgi:hypothetical protein